MHAVAARAARRRNSFAGVASIVSLSCLGAAADVRAADTAWTGGAGPSQSFWDLVANWSAGPPLSATTRALLGAFDTTLRSGVFEVDTLQGTGTLTMTGGELRIAGGGSTLGTLDLRGGNLYGGGDLTVQQLQWSGGSLGRTAYVDVPLTLTVTGPASISGNVDTGFGAGVPSGVTLLGVTTWQPGASSIEGLQPVTIGASGVFLDQASGGNHGFGAFGTLINRGRYEKTGAGTTSISAFPGFGNAGTFTVREGLVRFYGEAGSNWGNSGTLNVAGGQVDVSLFRGAISNGGTINVQAGQMSITTGGDSTLNSSGNWSVAPGALLTLTGAFGLVGGGGAQAATFNAGTLNNAGTVRFLFGRNIFSGSAQLTGPGLVEVLDGASLTVASALDIGGLRIARPAPFEQDGVILGYARSAVSLTGGLTVGTLDWADGSLTVGGPVTANGLATLSEDVEITLRSPPDVPGKLMNVPFRFNGGVTWDGNSDIYGSGSMAIAAGTTFEDRNTHGTLEATGAEPLARPTRIALAGGVSNAGTYLKTGAGQTVVASAFDNLGSVRSVDAGTLTFTGALNNAGTLEAVRSRIVAFGTLAQASLDTLSGGRYVMRDSRIVLNLGANAGGTGPALIVTSAADIVLDGPQAQLATTWLGSDVDALSGLRFNEGRLALLNGAVLEPGGDFVRNTKLVEIAGGSRLSVKARPFTFYSQSLGGSGDPDAVATWVDGTLEAGSITFSDGSFGAGGAASIGLAHLLGEVRFVSSRFDVDVTDHAHFDLVTIDGDVSLGGVLVVDFAGAPELGSYRILVADGGVSGSFGTLQSNLDPARYRVDALYGTDYVDLNVTAVPEPGTAMLCLAGLAALVSFTSAGARRRCRRPGSRS
jgi:hypothetical protein